MGKNSTVIYYDYPERFQYLSDAQFRQLIIAILSYAKTRQEPDIQDITVKVAFGVAKCDVDKNNHKYDSICERNRQNGQNGGRPAEKRLTDKTENNPVASNGTQDNPKVTVIVKRDSDRDSDNKGNVRKRTTHTAFSPPSVDDVRTYCKERKNSVEAQRFVDFYSSKGWKVGNQPMKDWKAAVRTWEQRDDTNRPKNTVDDQYTNWGG